MTRKILVLAFCRLLFTASPAEAASGRLDAAHGLVTVSRAGKTSAVKTGFELKGGDEVQTGKDAYALVTLDDGSKMKLRSDSAVSLAKDGALTEIFLRLGGVFTKVKKRAQGQGGFHVRTPNAVAAVRGTEFFTAYGRKKHRGTDLWLCVNEGAVEVSASKKSVLVKAGSGIVIKGGSDLTAPEAFEWTKTLNWNMDPEKGKLEDKTSLDGAYSDLLDQDYK